MFICLTPQRNEAEIKALDVLILKLLHLLLDVTTFIEEGEMDFSI
jgi:hypothetical protein